MIRLFEVLEKAKANVSIYEPFFQFINKKLSLKGDGLTFFSNQKDFKGNHDILLSIGGDGTFLESVTFVKNKGIPIAGINSGRLGFLANISKNEMELALKKILNKSYSFEERELIQLETPDNLFKNDNFALNEITVQKTDSSSMITIHVYLDGQFLNTYWADGLIISTPTGSTAYSLSAGGPIVAPNAKNYIITPLAPHNLTIRPIVIPNHHNLTLKIEGRDQNYLVSLDHRHKVFSNSVELKIRKSKFKIKMLKHDDRTFYSTLREKLMWGLDKRN
ncbi:MAG: NAD kinase [Bacteroidetes bacterium]|nr:MAG: NAD kinase [Bacteroidota bacterium]